MEKPLYEQNDGSDWKRATPACNFIHCSRSTLEKLAAAANAKRTFGRNAFYNVKWIETYIVENG